jgi:hypothetical protein
MGDVFGDRATPAHGACNLHEAEFVLLNRGFEMGPNPFGETVIRAIIDKNNFAIIFKVREILAKGLANLPQSIFARDTKADIFHEPTDVERKIITGSMAGCKAYTFFDVGIY